MDRRNFLLTSSLTAAAFVIAPSLSFGQDKPADSTKPTAPVKPPPLAPELVKEFVGAGHNNLARVKEMLAEHPNLLYSMWDWGGGDFETAIEGAGHVGDPEIAEYLINQGTRPNIFVLTMLGKTSIVKGLLEAYPVLLNSRGPHGFSLLHHAERGGESSAELLDFIQSKGLKEKKFPLY